ncbi:ETX/MTX2 family pore-forming toxin [Bacillus cereus]|nr:ETX/MTX2 family pore-forming toxin [Bacillus cereus]MEB8666849.1 ETX/MTX2 family pore-forming toxin [Bacillus cereus]
MIIDLFSYLTRLVAADVIVQVGGNPRPPICTSLNNFYNDTIQGIPAPPTFNLDPSKININDLVVTYPELDTVGNIVSSIANSNSFTNTGFETNETYLTPEITRTLTETITTTTTRGFKFTQGFTYTNKINLRIPIAGSESTISFSTAFEQNISTTDTITKTEAINILVPRQTVIVRPRTTKTVDIRLYQLQIPRVFTEISGYVTGTLPSVLNSNPDIYAALVSVNNRCPNTFVNRDNNLRIDHERRGLGLGGSGSFNANIISLDFLITTTERDLDTNAIINIDNTLGRAAIQRDEPCGTIDSTEHIDVIHNDC